MAACQYVGIRPEGAALADQPDASEGRHAPQSGGRKGGKHAFAQVDRPQAVGAEQCHPAISSQSHDLVLLGQSHTLLGRYGDDAGGVVVAAQLIQKVHVVAASVGVIREEDDDQRTIIHDRLGPMAEPQR